MTKSVSNIVFAATVAVLIIIAGVGYGLYFMNISSKPTTPTLAPKILGYSGGFLNGQPVTFYYYQSTPYECTPSTGSLFSGISSNINSTAPCEVGKPGSFPSNAIPFWVTVPAFAGLSIFGVPALGATPEGFPTYNGKIILTQCAADASAVHFGCVGHPAYLYSPAFTVVEQFLGIQNGYGGLPEGVLPTPAHDHIVDTAANSQNIPWYTVAVLVFDPNIWPDPVTGKCYQIVPSSLSNATANCLNSLTALENALTTTNAAIADANKNNPIWQALGKPLTQVVIPGVSNVSQIRNANSNLDVFFAVNITNLYPPVKTSSISISKEISMVYSGFIQYLLQNVKLIGNLLTTLAGQISIQKEI